MRSLRPCMMLIPLAGCSADSVDKPGSRRSGDPATANVTSPTTDVSATASGRAIAQSSAEASARPAPTTSADASANQMTRSVDGAVMLHVPAGEFIRGSPPDVGDADEHPQRRIALKAFLIDRLETTRSQYARCVDAGGCKPPIAKSGAATRECNWTHDDRNEHPINCVDHRDAVEYCRWAGARLPTEAEWEKAARGTDGRSHPWGNAAPSCELAAMPTPAGIAGCGDKTTLPVGSRPQGVSPYGALDMSGNVWEWVADYYVEDYYAKAPATDPQGPTNGAARGLRGGSWEVHDTLHLRTANRYRFAASYRFHALGIRCAQDAR